MLPDDMRIPQSFEIAKEEGMDFVIENKDIKGAHPNTEMCIRDRGIRALRIVDLLFVNSVFVNVRRICG